MIRYACGACGAQLESDDENAGREERCACGAVNTVPQRPKADVQPERVPVTPRLVTADYVPYTVTSDAAGKATASLTLGIISCVAWACPLVGLAVSIPGIILGVQSQRLEGSGRARKGIVLSVVGLMLSIVNVIAGMIVQVE
ncbi:MAG: DUF4190 domain-containing protein [Planctomycetes bacterium]|nr:DUF4190 domain-containing protein [Planctomycetota bacterium]